MEIHQSLRAFQPPCFHDYRRVASLLCELYSFESIDYPSMEELKGHVDRTYYFRGSLGSEVKSTVTGEYVLKVNRKDPALVRGRAEVMKYLADGGIPCSVPVNSRSGMHFEVIAGRVEGEYLVDLRSRKTSHNLAKEEFILQVFTYIPGCTMNSLKDPAPNLLFQVGEMVGSMDALLKEFIQPELEKYISLWDLRSFLDVKKFPHLIENGEKIAVVQAVSTLFKTAVIPFLPEFKQGIVHNDIHGMNIIVNPKVCQVVGIIDFGDCNYSCYLFELATSVAEIMTMDMDDPFSFVSPFICGYLSKFSLIRNELNCLYVSVLARLCQSACSTNSKNDSLLTFKDKQWRLIKLLLGLPKEEVEKWWKISS